MNEELDGKVDFGLDFTIAVLVSTLVLYAVIQEFAIVFMLTTVVLLKCFWVTWLNSRIRRDFYLGNEKFSQNDQFMDLYPDLVGPAEHIWKRSNGHNQKQNTMFLKSLKSARDALLRTKSLHEEILKTSLLKIILNSDKFLKNCEIVQYQLLGVHRKENLIYTLSQYPLAYNEEPLGLIEESVVVGLVEKIERLVDSGITNTFYTDAPNVDEQTLNYHYQQVFDNLQIIQESQRVAEQHFKTVVETLVKIKLPHLNALPIDWAKMEELRDLAELAYENCRYIDCVEICSLFFREDHRIRKVIALRKREEPTVSTTSEPSLQ